MSSTFRKIAVNAINIADKAFGLRAMIRLDSEQNQKKHPLSGDREIEWSWVLSHLPKESSTVLDFGCVDSPLTSIAAHLGHKVTGVDLREIGYEMPGMNFIRGDILKLDFGQTQFDSIINCSAIEHVGLEGRYGSEENSDGDLLGMKRLHSLLAGRGKMIMTIPVGIDEVVAPFHRIYGHKRFPLLVEGYQIHEEEYWHKRDKNDRWIVCDKDTAFAVRGSFEAYALGLFVLTKSAV